MAELKRVDLKTLDKLRTGIVEAARTRVAAAEHVLAEAQDAMNELVSMGMPEGATGFNFDDMTYFKTVEVKVRKRKKTTRKAK